jgi:thioesterase domain-containing protein
MQRMTDWLRPPAPAEEDELGRALRSVRESALLAETRYVPRLYPGRLTLFRAAQQPPTFDHDPEDGWKEIAAGGIDIYDVPGDHYSLLSEPNVQVLARELKGRMHAALPAQPGASARRHSLPARAAELPS